MRYAYFDESDKYDSLKNKIQEAGHRVIASPRSQVGDRILIGRRDGPAYFVVGKSKSKGWFICLNGPTYYLLPTEAQVFQLCLRLLKQPGIGQDHWPSIDEALKQELHLAEIDGLAWFSIEQEENRQVWRECGWHELSDFETSACWSALRNWYEVVFPFLTMNSFDLSWLYQIPETEFERFENIITLKALDALRKKSKVDEEVVVYQQNHNTYLFNPHSHPATVLRDHWVMPILPDGDSYYYMAKDFRFGILSDWESRTIRTFGLDLLVIPDTLGVAEEST